MNTKLLPGEGRILCAVSGGADSMYLLCRLGELGYDLAAAHYNHGLRGEESDRDEAFVRRFCKAKGIPFLSEKGDVAAYAAARRQGTEEAARALRYAFLERAADALGAAVIATAHTADDNAETILLHLTRGAGLRGLTGIPPVRGRIVRPMLDTAREEVEAYLAEKCIPFVEDSTNAADGYARNRVRHGVIPALRAENPALLPAMGRTAELLRRDEAFLQGLARDFLRENADETGVSVSALRAQPWPVASRAVRLLAGGDLSERHVEAVLRAAEEGGAADVPGLRIARAGDRLVFGPEAKPSLPARTVPLNAVLPLPEAGLSLKCEKIAGCPADVYKSFNIFYFKCENICGNMTVTARLPGDRFRPRGRGCTKTLKALFQESGVPPWERDAVPVLRDDEGILGVYGVGPAERACAAPGDKDVWKIEFIRL